jgi:catechol 2,3-dioxygenase-like lactoylglutathione lyase family enzyme
MFLGINHVTIVVRDKKEAEHFYFDLLGFEKLNIGNFLWAKVGQQYIHINENVNCPEPGSFCHFAVEVENLIPHLKKLIDKGVDVFDLGENLEAVDLDTNLEKENRNYFIKDPTGNIIEFINSSNKFYKP